MNILDKIFENMTPNVERLKTYGFKENGNALEYSAVILDGGFEMNVSIAGGIRTKVVDLTTGEPYALHLVEDAQGEFVGNVRKAYCEVLQDIADKCCLKGTFKSECARNILKYIEKTYDDKLEYLWDKFPRDAICRRKDNRKWYALFVVLPRIKLGLDGDGETEIAVLRVEKNTADNLIKFHGYLPAYHMNKKNWITVLLDGCVEYQDICKLIDASYTLAK